MNNNITCNSENIQQHADNSKLNLELPSIEFTYSFWSKIFTEDKLNQLKLLISNNENDLENIITNIIPSYKISDKFNNYINIYYNQIKNRSDNDIIKSKSILSGILIIIGILTYKFII